MPKRRIGLALSGGGARGLAHIGVLKVLEQSQISIEIISGTSMGGLIAAGYAMGQSPEEMTERALKLAHPRELIKLMDLNPLRRGLLEGNRIREYIIEMIGVDTTFEQTRLPLALNAVDLFTCKEVTLTEGPLSTAVMATTCVPGLFSPVEYGPYRLVDGGVLNNVPVAQARALGADFIIAVDVMLDPRNFLPWPDLPIRPHWPIPMPDFFLDFYRAELLMQVVLSEKQLTEQKPDIVIRPQMANDITMFMGFPKAGEAIEAGITAAQEAVPMIIKQIEQVT